MQHSFGVHGAAGYYLMRDVLATGHRGVWPQLGVALDDALLTDVLDAFETTLVTVIEPYPSAIEVLATIRAHGIATAIVSVNDEQLLQDCVDACGLRPYFDVVLSSEAARSCKPEPGMFELAMRALAVPAADTVFVGDMPEMDIVGAKRVGMCTVLTTEGAGFIGELHDAGPDGVPDATIASLAELPALLGLG
jgi:putative hydrolase of the HAD superfamily